MFRVAVSPREICSNRSSSLAPVAAATGLWPDRRKRWARASPSVRARARSLAARISSPACGGSEKPSTCTGVEGSASLMWSPRSSTSAFTLPQAAPATTGSPTRRVPCWTITVATGPRPASRLASSTTPRASPSTRAVSSSTSATSTICSSRLSIPVPCRAETSTTIVSPPHASGTSPRSESCWRTRGESASGRSILLTATMMGTSAALAWSMASTVWGITPSSAATTRITMSVTCAPRARMAVKAAWPGVSMNVMGWPCHSTW